MRVHMMTMFKPSCEYKVYTALEQSAGRLNCHALCRGIRLISVRVVRRRSPATYTPKLLSAAGPCRRGACTL